jgi:hypothetical protein
MNQNLHIVAGALIVIALIVWFFAAQEESGQRPLRGEE